ncbi:hypothetical protein GcM3_019026 [Golovinomyces cichoracearum]|uniref:Uncharacterized protein n=1 Tax=Golovinomyces cichoracearum TaxID=62708 RepID=A0A420J838_9PEZI|nr:hypothetical protein GcM3_019026 [Golovinomyces cichoracearum]
MFGKNGFNSIINLVIRAILRVTTSIDRTDNRRNDITTTYSVKDASELFATQDIGKKFDPKDTGRLTEPIVNGYISYLIEAWKVLKYKYDDLWMAYQEDFENWSEETFKIAHVNAIRSLRYFLRENGVFFNKAKSVNMIKSLMETLDETDHHIWTPLEIQYQLARVPMNSRLIAPPTEKKDPEVETYGTKPTLIYKNDDAKQIPTFSPSQKIPFK